MSVPLRLNKDMKDLEQMTNTTVDYPNEDDPLNFIVSVKVTEGYYQNHWIKFSFNIPTGWPFEMPKVLALSNLWHPNIKPLEDGGKVCVSYLKEGLRDGYTPARTLYDIIESLRFILVNPNFADPLNKEAAKQHNKDPESFEKKVQEYLNSNNN